MAFSFGSMIDPDSFDPRNGHFIPPTARAPVARGFPSGKPLPRNTSFGVPKTATRTTGRTPFSFGNLVAPTRRTTTADIFRAPLSVLGLSMGGYGDTRDNRSIYDDGILRRVRQTMDTPRVSTVKLDGRGDALKGLVGNAIDDFMARGDGSRADVHEAFFKSEPEPAGITPVMWAALAALVGGGIYYAAKK